ncbi:MAG: hypothetical protein K2O73_05580 [Lachnospiraceae bacterium]|nr:hypothetical protein [Lachnospiraceae bacterium]
MIKKSVFILVTGLAVLISLVIGIYTGRSMTFSNGQALNGQLSYSLAEVTTEMAEYVRTEYENMKDGFKRYWKNPWYAMFYGEWEATDIVYVDPLPLQGVQGGGFLTEEEQEDVKIEFAQRMKEEIPKIKFAQDQIVVNDTRVIEKARYNVIAFPTMDDYLIHFTMTLADIGLTEEKGDYYVFVAASGYENKKNLNGEWGLGHLLAAQFFVKDENTLIFYEGSWCIEYKRVSYEGGREDPVIIVG